MKHLLKEVPWTPYSILQIQTTIHDSQLPKGNSREVDVAAEKCFFYRKMLVSCREKPVSCRNAIFERHVAGNRRKRQEVSGLKNQER